MSEQIELINIEVTKSSVELLKCEIDKNIREGKYDFEQCQNVIIAINNINKSLQVLNNLQNIAIRLQQREKQKSENKTETKIETEPEKATGMATEFKDQFVER
jgi:hypothetical protein